MQLITHLKLKAKRAKSVYEETYERATWVGSLMGRLKTELDEGDLLQALRLAQRVFANIHRRDPESPALAPVAEIIGKIQTAVGRRICPEHIERRRIAALVEGVGVDEYGIAPADDRSAYIDALREHPRDYLLVQFCADMLEE